MIRQPSLARSYCYEWSASPRLLVRTATNDPPVLVCSFVLLRMIRQSSFARSYYYEWSASPRLLVRTATNDPPALVGSFVLNTIHFWKLWRTI